MEGSYQQAYYIGDRDYLREKYDRIAYAKEWNDRPCYSGAVEQGHDDDQ
jgi:hypothetical protein